MNPSAKDKGRLVLWRKIEDSWQWEKPLYRAAWMWILMKAAYKAHNGLKPGQCYFTLSQAKTAWGMTISQARTFIRRCVQERDITWEPGRPGVGRCAISTSNRTSDDTSNRTSDDTCRGKITLLNYLKYKAGTTADDTSDDTSNRTCLKPSIDAIEKQSIRNKVKKYRPDSAESANPNSQVYDFFVNRKRKAHKRENWLPSANQARQLRANIKTLLDQGYSAEELTAWLNNFFADEKMIEKGYPWRFFMDDPIRWQKKNPTDLSQEQAEKQRKDFQQEEDRLRKASIESELLWKKIEKLPESDQQLLRTKAEASYQLPKGIKTPEPAIRAKMTELYLQGRKINND